MSADTPRRELLSIPQACLRADVSRRTIYNWLDAGKIEFVRTAGGRIRIYADSLFRDATRSAVLPASERLL